MADPLEKEISNLYEEWLSRPTPAICARLADQLRQSGRCDESIEVATDGLEQWPDNISINVVLGRSLRNSEKLDLASGIFEQVRKLDPLNLIALRNLAEIAFESEQWTRSIGLLEEYLFEYPADSESEKMLEHAKFKSKSEPSEESDDSADSTADEAAATIDTAGTEASGQTPDVFPQTDRMTSILQTQDAQVPPEPRPAAQPESTVVTEPPVPSPAPAERKPLPNGPREPRSLIDLFSEDERKEMKLEEYGDVGE